MPKRSAIINKAAINVRKLTVHFRGTAVLRDVDLRVPVGSLTAIVGPNGSGKTTLVRAILGLVPIAHGTVEFFGQPLHDMRTCIGYVPQRFDFDRDIPITVGEFLSLARRSATPRTHIIHTLKEVGLPPATLQKTIGTLSGGQLQRVLIAQAILNNPSILVLDEPATGIDEKGEATIMQVLEHLREKHATTIVMITHDLDLVADAATQVVRL